MCVCGGGMVGGVSGGPEKQILGVISAKDPATSDIKGELNQGELRSSPAAMLA